MSDKSPLIRRPKKASLASKYIAPTVKFPKSIMVWGCFTASGPKKIVFIEGTMDSKKYMAMLEEFLSNDIDLDLNNKLFQQYNAPCHTSGAMKKWFERKKINVLEWPGNSPDLNPIENLWALMKRKLIKKCPSNITDLKEKICEIWHNEITPYVTNNLIKSMQTRINEVIKNKGYYTNY